MVDYRHPRRPSTRTVPVGETIRLRAGESVTLGSRTVTYRPDSVQAGKA